MHKETVVAKKENEVTARNLSELGAADQQKIAGPKRRHHARAGDLKAEFTKASENLRGQAALARLIPGGDGRGHNHAPGYEVFLFELHDPCVGLTLPQESAMVSKIRSCRNAGF
jgi:hypothetical protein